VTTLSEAYNRLASLSPERAERVLSLIDDLAELEALENAQDVMAARKFLEEKNPETVDWESLKRELDDLHGQA
jgi:hypothetical protein